MTTLYVQYCSRVKLPCAGAARQDVILCVKDAALVAPVACPEPSNLGFQHPFIAATICQYYTSGKDCGPTTWCYKFSYDDALLADGSVPLSTADITGVFCKDCLTDYFEYLAGSDVYLEVNDDESQSLVNQHGCVYPIGSGGADGAPVGAILMWLGLTPPSGYLFLNSTYIGDAGSGADGRANSDCLSLFVFLWTNLTQADAPVSGGRGVSAVADFLAQKVIKLPDSRQHFPLGLKGAGGQPGESLGQVGGYISHTHEIDPHFHGMGNGADLNIVSSGSHSHDVQRSNEAASSAGTNTSPVYRPQAGTGTNFFATQTALHVHGSADFDGHIGNVDGGVSGDATMNSGQNSLPPPFFTVNFIIKY